MGLLSYFKKDVPKTPKWVAVIEADWVGGKDKVHYNLFVDEAGKRSCKMDGLGASQHPEYLTKVYPWLCGAPDDILIRDLNQYEPTYWADCIARNPGAIDLMTPKAKKKV